ncbi:hypothetical protein BDW62DRAFT_214113 [Aspergillus aurantiobrunneus]
MVKHCSSMDSQLHKLTALKRIEPKGYLRYVFLFQLQDNYDLNQVARIIQAGYEALTDRIPEVACEAIPDPGSACVVVKDLRDSFASSYAELKSRAFLVASFDGDTLCRRSVWPSVGERLPISFVQANFIRGGLLLTWCILHMAGDGRSFYLWTKAWAEECRRAQGLDVAEPIQFPDAIWNDRQQVMRPLRDNAGKLEDHPEYTLLAFTPAGAPPKMLSPSHRGQVFYFSSESLAALKAESLPAHATEPSDQSWISTNNALSALVWRTVMARTDPKVHPDTLGCFLEYVAVSMLIRKMLSTLNLADLAQLDDVDRLVPTAFLDVPGFNCVLTSRINFELYGLDWGSLPGSRIEAVRVPHVGCINGCQVVLPVLPDGGMEVVVGVEESCLHRLLEDPLLAKVWMSRCQKKTRPLLIQARK